MRGGVKEGREVGREDCEEERKENVEMDEGDEGRESGEKGAAAVRDWKR